MENIEKLAIEKSIEESKFNLSNNYTCGGPFGAAIVKDGKIIASAHNTVVESKDATAHAEVNVIRKASQILNTHDLSGCILYTSCYPCPMCLSAIIWANIKEIYYCNSKEDADKIGFRDDVISEYLSGNKNDLIKINHIENQDALKVFDDFSKNKDKTMY